MSKLYVKYRGHIIVKYMSHICILNVNEVEEYSNDMRNRHILTDFKNAYYLQIVRWIKICIEQQQI